MTQSRTRKPGGMWLAALAVALLLLGVFLLVRTGQVNREYDILAQTTPVPSQAPPALAFRELAPLYRYGSVGPEVIALQERLQELGYYQAEIDGKYYDGTQAAVKVFQMQHGLDADGIAGEKTLAVLRSDQAKPYQPPTDTAAPSATPSNEDGSYNQP